MDFQIAGSTGDSWYVVLRQNTNGTLGNTWDDVAASWVASPTGGDEQVSLSEDGTTGMYTGATSVGTLETYTGFVTVYYYDGLTDELITGDQVYMVTGVAQRVAVLDDISGLGLTASSAIQVAKHRTWELWPGNEANVSPQVLWLSPGSTITLAMDFERWLNPDTTVNSVDSVVDSETLLTIGNLKRDQSATKAHFDITAGMVAGNRHTLTVTVSTSDGQTFSVKGVMQVV